MADTRTLPDIRADLVEGLKLSGQSSYERRQPRSRSIPVLRKARLDLLAYVRAMPDDPEGWRALSLASEALMCFDKAKGFLERAVELSAKPTKKDLVRLAELAEQVAKWKRLSLSPEELAALGKHLEVHLTLTRCDESNGATRRWLEATQPESAERILVELGHRGGYCDCEILANVVH